MLGPVGDLYPHEVTALARPMSRMLSRHTPVQKALRTYTDPVLLAGTLAAIVRVRLGYLTAQRAGAPPQQQEPTAAPSAPPPAEVSSPSPPPAPPAQPPPRNPSVFAAPDALAQLRDTPI